jgi:hypothetical protein
VPLAIAPTLDPFRISDILTFGSALAIPVNVMPQEPPPIRHNRNAMAQEVHQCC